MIAECLRDQMSSLCWSRLDWCVLQHC